MVNHHQQKVLVGRHHDLVFAGAEPGEGQLVAVVLVEVGEQLFGRGHDLVDDAAEGVRGLGVQTGLDRGAVRVEDEDAPHAFGRTQFPEFLLQLGSHFLGFTQTTDTCACKCNTYRHYQRLYCNQQL